MESKAENNTAPVESIPKKEEAVPEEKPIENEKPIEKEAAPEEKPIENEKSIEKEAAPEEKPIENEKSIEEEKEASPEEKPIEKEVASEEKPTEKEEPPKEKEAAPEEKPIEKEEPPKEKEASPEEKPIEKEVASEEKPIENEKPIEKEEPPKEKEASPEEKPIENEKPTEIEDPLKEKPTENKEAPVEKETAPEEAKPAKASKGPIRDFADAKSKRFEQKRSASSGWSKHIPQGLIQSFVIAGPDDLEGDLARRIEIMKKKEKLPQGHEPDIFKVPFTGEVLDAFPWPGKKNLTAESPELLFPNGINITYGERPQPTIYHTILTSDDHKQRYMTCLMVHEQLPLERVQKLKDTLWEAFYAGPRPKGEDEKKEERKLKGIEKKKKKEEKKEEKKEDEKVDEKKDEVNVEEKKEDEKVEEEKKEDEKTEEKKEEEKNEVEKKEEINTENKTEEEKKEEKKEEDKKVDVEKKKEKKEKKEKKKKKHDRENNDGKGYFIPKVLCLMSSIPCYTFARNWLSAFYSLWAQGGSSLSVETAIAYATRVPLPLPGAAPMDVKLEGRELGTVFYPPPSELPYMDFPLYFLFDYLSIESVIRVFWLLLLDEKVILVSRNESVLTFIGDGLQALLYPLVPTANRASVLPFSAHECLGSPVSYIYGVKRDVFDAIPREFVEGAAVVDVDSDTVELAKEQKGLPAIPPTPLALLRCELNELKNRDKSKMTEITWDPWATPFSHTKEFNVYVRIAFIKFFAAFLRGYQAFVHYIRVFPTPIVRFNKGPFINTFLKSEKSTERDSKMYVKFFNAFFATQQFNHFVERASTESTLFDYILRKLFVAASFEDVWKTPISTIAHAIAAATRTPIPIELKATRIPQKPEASLEAGQEQKQEEDGKTEGNTEQQDTETAQVSGYEALAALRSLDYGAIVAIQKGEVMADFEEQIGKLKEKEKEKKISGGAKFKSMKPPAKMLSTLEGAKKDKKREKGAKKGEAGMSPKASRNTAPLSKGSMHSLAVDPKLSFGDGSSNNNGDGSEQPKREKEEGEEKEQQESPVTKPIAQGAVDKKAAAVLEARAQVRHVGEVETVACSSPQEFIRSKFDMKPVKDSLTVTLQELLGGKEPGEKELKEEPKYKAFLSTRGGKTFIQEEISKTPGNTTFTLSEAGFAYVGSLVRYSLVGSWTKDKTDFTAAKAMLRVFDRLSFINKAGHRVFMYEHMKDIPVWKEQDFWAEFFEENMSTALDSLYKDIPATIKKWHGKPTEEMVESEKGMTFSIVCSIVFLMKSLDVSPHRMRKVVTNACLTVGLGQQSLEQAKKLIDMK